MLFRNAQVLLPDGVFEKRDVLIENGIIQKVCDSIEENECSEEIVDVKGNYLIPGYIDIHTHGCMSKDYCDADIKSLNTMTKYLASKGVTSVLATTMSLNEETLTKILSVISTSVDKYTGSATIRGVYLEGPFINTCKKGAQNEKYIIPADEKLLQRLNNASGNSIKIVALAPECNNNLDCIKSLSQHYTISLAHTASNYDTAIKAFENGATQVTHLFNAMPPINHREPGVIPAAREKAKHVELICDGFHIHPSVIRLSFKLFGASRICLISDSMSACGMNDGQYMLGGQEVFVKNHKATLKDGTIAASVCCLADCVRNAIKFGVSKEEAFIAATKSPAQAANIYDKVGSIEVGKDADIQILSKNFNLKDVYIKGNKVIQENN